MFHVSPVTSTPPTLASSLTPAHTQQKQNSFVPITDKMSSLAPPRQKEIKGAELVVKSIIAGTIGILPFLTSKVGEVLVKGCALLVEKARNVIHTLKPSYGASFLEIVVRGSIGIPAVIGGGMLFGGAVIFSKLQALVWGQDLIEHPQEERINTKLARYGAGGKPFEDFKKLLYVFFTPIDSWIGTAEGVDSDGEPAVEFVQTFDLINDIKALQKFEAT